MKTLRLLAFRILRVLLLSYVGVILVLMYLENSFVYQGSTEKEHWEPAPFASGTYEDVYLTLPGGVKVHGWYLIAPGSEDSYLFFHGNGGNLSHRAGSIAKIRDQFQSNVLIIDYPGYGKSEGTPSETGCYQAADAAYDWLVQTKKLDPRRMVLYGGSLGGGVATWVASRKPHRALVLAKTFTSLPDVGQRRFPWIPVRWLMRNRFDNAARIGQCKQPVFITHGDADEVIPFDMGQRLYELANEPKEFLLLPGAGHDDGLPPIFVEKLKAFLDRHP